MPAPHWLPAPVVRVQPRLFDQELAMARVVATNVAPERIRRRARRCRVSRDSIGRSSSVDDRRIRRIRWYPALTESGFESPGTQLARRDGAGRTGRANGQGERSRANGQAARFDTERSESAAQKLGGVAQNRMTARSGPGLRLRCGCRDE